MYIYMSGRKWRTFKILTGKPKRKRPLGRTRRRWKGNIRMNLKEIGRLIRVRIAISGEPF